MGTKRLSDEFDHDRAVEAGMRYATRYDDDDRADALEHAEAAYEGSLIDQLFQKFRGAVMDSSDPVASLSLPASESEIKEVLDLLHFERPGKDVEAHSDGEWVHFYLTN